VIFRRPGDEPVQLLPGRLVVLQGDEETKEIRFARLLGEPAQISLGRDEGPPHKHVRLHSATVSRMHASMEFSSGRWTVTNLSRTNPLVLNGEELHGVGDQRALSDGDRLELGEAIFRFQAR